MYKRIEGKAGRAARQAVNVKLKDGEVSYLVLDSGKDSGDLVKSFGTDVIFDSYTVWPADAPERVKVLDAMMGPGYWAQAAPTEDEDGEPLKTTPKPSRAGPRLIVLGGESIVVEREGLVAKTKVSSALKAVEGVEVKAVEADDEKELDGAVKQMDMSRVDEVAELPEGGIDAGDETKE